MHSISSFLATITRTCSACTSHYEGLNLPSLTLCPSCSHAAATAELTAYQERQRAQVEAIVDARLTAIGLARAERRARLDGVPLDIKRLLPYTVRAVLKGQTPAVGFGIMGSQGAGKTMALAAIIRAGVTDLVTSAIASLDRIPSDGEEPWRWAGRMLWLSWPSVAAQLKATVSQDRNGGQEAEQRVARAINIPLLVLDDLGRERTRGAYTEDYAIGQLDRIIDARSREERPILWTANATAAYLVKTYGGALMSRLVGLAPPISLPALPDQRLNTA